MVRISSSYFEENIFSMEGGIFTGHTVYITDISGLSIDDNVRGVYLKLGGGKGAGSTMIGVTVANVAGEKQISKLNSTQKTMVTASHI